MDRSFIVTLARFHRVQPEVYVVQGYFQGNYIAGSRMSADLDGERLPLEVSCREGLSIRQKYFSKGIGYENIDREYDLWITLPKETGHAHALHVWQELEGKRKCVFRMRIPRLEKERSLPDGYLETFREDDASVSIGGWAVGSGPCRVRVLDAKGQELPSRVTRYYRQDIADLYPELQEAWKDEPERLSFGYEVTFPKPGDRRVKLIVSSKGQRMVWPVNLDRGLKGISGGSVSMWRKASAYLKRNGVRRTVKRSWEKAGELLSGHRGNEAYMSWRKRHEPTKEELAAQEKNVFLHQPLISVVVPLYRTDPVYLRELVASMQAQTYRHWELCLSDGSGEPSPLSDELEKLQEKDERIRVISPGRVLAIPENTNEALSIAGGEFIAFADHDDKIAPDALYEFVRKINEEPEAELLYSDEDKVSMDGKRYFEPHFKSDYNIDLLCSMNYICHMLMVSRGLYERVGGMDPAFNGAQDYDFILRCAEVAKQICHIPRALYHWRSHPASTAENPESKRYAFEAGCRAVQAHYDRLGIPAQVVMGAYPGLYRTIYEMPQQQPLISIIIPNKDHVEDLDKCVMSILHKSTYDNFEILVVENNSDLEETFDYYRNLELADERVRILKWEDAFNFSAINNFGVKEAKGDYLLFLNNDTELISPSALEELLGPCLRPEVGAVGARLYYQDGTIQHAGVILGYGGIAGHAFGGFPENANGYFSRIICQSDLSAVTAACMLVKRTAFEEAGGFDETLKVAFNDIDLCLKLREKGYLVVYNPFAELYHYESKSRGLEDSPGKIARFNAEADELIRRWAGILEAGDPYYNPNLSLDRNDFGLKP